MSRNLYCPENEAICEDPRCKKGACILEQGDRERERAPPSRIIKSRMSEAVIQAEAAAKARIAEIIARQTLDLKGNRQPTEAQVTRMMKRAWIIAEAEKRLSDPSRGVEEMLAEAMSVAAKMEPANDRLREIP